MKRLERAVPLSLLGLCLLAIALRLAGVIPPIVASDDFEISRTIFMDAGIGGLLAVFAIVISLTLMGIQFASQEYTHRVMNTYLSSAMLWTMMGVYLITILYNLYMVAFLRTPVDPLLADISVMLQTLCLVLLVPHFVTAVIHLKPDYTISRVLDTVSFDYLNSIKDYLRDDRGLVPHKLDRLLPAIEIIEKSIERGDRATVRVGLEGLSDSYGRFVTSENEDWLSRYYTDYFLRLGREAVIEADDDSVVQVLDALGKIASSTSSAGTVSRAVNHIRNIGGAALKKEYDAAVEQMIDSLKQVLLVTAGDDTVRRILETFGEVARSLFSMQNRALVLFLTERLSGAAAVLARKQDEAALKKLIAVLEEMGVMAITAGNMRDVIHEVIRAFYLLGTGAAEARLDLCDSLVESLVRMERQISRTDRDLFSELNYTKQEIEQCRRKHTPDVRKDAGIQTSDLW